MEKAVCVKKGDHVAVRKTNRSNLRRNISVYARLTIAAFIMSAGVVWIFNAQQIVPGGVTGIGIIVENVTGIIPVWATNLVFNIPLFYFGYKFLKKDSMIKTAYTTILSTIFMAALSERALLTEDRLLNMLAGGTMFGIAYGLMFRENASSGGVDLLALILNKFRRDISAPVILGIVDVAIILAGGLAFGIENMLYAIIAVLISTKLSDFLIQGVRKRKLVYIISDRYEQIRDSIIKDIKRGVTVIKVNGGFMGSDRVMLLCVLSSRELVELQEKIRKIDKNSFFIISQISAVFGEGFTNLSQ